MNRFVPTATGQHLTIRRKGHRDRSQSVLYIEDGLILTARTHPTAVIVPSKLATSGQGLPIRRKRPPPCASAIMSFEDGLLLTGGHIPQTNRLVPTATGQRLTIRRERASDATQWNYVLRGQPFADRRTHPTNSIVAVEIATSGQGLPIRRKRHRCDPIPHVLRGRPFADR